MHSLFFHHFLNLRSEVTNSICYSGSANIKQVLQLTCILFISFRFIPCNAYFCISVTNLATGNHLGPFH